MAIARESSAASGASDPLILPPPSPATSKSGGHYLLRSKSNAGDELRSFRSCLRLMCMDQSSTFQSLVSWSLFLLLAIAVPAASHFALDYSPARHPYDAAVQLSLTAASALAFLRLSHLLSRYGLRRLLSLDKLPYDTVRVRRGYTAELSRSFRLLAVFIIPCTASQAAYRVWLYSSGEERVPVLAGAVACSLEVASWVYRTGSFFLGCVLFRAICSLQILRLQDFAAVFREESEVAAVLREHLRIRRQLRVISHRFRSFIVTGLVIVTASQFGTLLLTTRPHAEVNLFNGTELALCSIGLVAGLLICLRSAAKITHKAQALTSHAAMWHVSATIDSYEEVADPEVPSSTPRALDGNDGSDDEDDTGAEDELEDTKILQPNANTISFQKRQALVTYLENNMAGITVFGFVLDRTCLHTIFMLELSLVLWLLGKTIGIS